METSGIQRLPLPLYLHGSWLTRLIEARFGSRHKNSGDFGTSPDSSSSEPFFNYREFIDLSSEKIDHRLRFAVWADDTASVTINDSKVFIENLTQDDACADGPIGCEPGDKGVFDLILGAGKLHNLDISVFQTGGTGWAHFSLGQWLRPCPASIYDAPIGARGNWVSVAQEQVGCALMRTTPARRTSRKSSKSRVGDLPTTS